MKTETAQYLTIVSIIALILFVAPVSAFATDQTFENDADHIALAHFYENQAKEMQAKIDEQIEALSHKPRSSRFGKHGKDIKKHVEYKIDQLEKAAEENLQKAAYHRKMAEEQSIHPSFAESNKTKG